MSYLFKRLKDKRRWNKLMAQRLSEPLHLNIIAFFVYLFGSFRKKVGYDLVMRPYSAFGILSAADKAKQQGFKKVTLIEFGVANGAGLMNIIKIADRVTKTTGVEFDIYGFDSGKGMPEPIDYRDHPEYYNTGDFPMNKKLLEENINGKATIVYGSIKEQLSNFISRLDASSPIGYISVDVDYYSSTKEVFKLLEAKAAYFLPLTYIYFDDIFMDHHNAKCGELLAIQEFNNVQKLRQIEHHPFLVNKRLFKNANWIKQLYYFHVLDHEHRYNINRERKHRVLDNPYLDFKGNESKFN